jgi:hypothetical protein
MMKMVVTYQLCSRVGTQEYVGRRMADIVQVRERTPYADCHDEAEVGRKFAELLNARLSYRWPHLAQEFPELHVVVHSVAVCEVPLAELAPLALPEMPVATIVRTAKRVARHHLRQVPRSYPKPHSARSFRPQAGKAPIKGKARA